MAPYFSDERRAAVWAEIMSRTHWAADQERDGFWITYLIRDPRYPDMKGQPGLPFYVGQTKDFAHRVFTRFRTCEMEARKKGKDCVEKRVADLLHLDVVAQYEVLSYQPTHLSSLVDETNMARECRNRGYDITNHAELQKEAGPRVDRHRIPKSWIWDRFSIVEAEQDGVKIEMRCSVCAIQLEVSAGSFNAIQRPPKTLKQIQNDPMWSKEPCPLCGQLGHRSLRLSLS